MNHPANLIIDALGGTGKAADACQVTPEAVSQWRKNGIPGSREQFLRIKYKRLDWSGYDEGMRAYVRNGEVP